MSLLQSVSFGAIQEVVLRENEYEARLSDSQRQALQSGNNSQSENSDDSEDGEELVSPSA